MKSIKVSIAGASGITGFELIKILDTHKNCKIESILSRTYANQKLKDVFPSALGFKNYSNLKFQSDFSTDNLLNSDLIFFCLPSGKSMEYILKIKDVYKGKIIDLGSDFRLNNPADFEKWYEKKHILKDLLPNFCYGLSEINRDLIKDSKYVANPGCYPTSVLLALAPLLKEKVFKINSIIIDSKSGVSGAGKKLKEDYLFLNISDNFFAYSAILHRHIPEIEQEINKLSGLDYKITFTPHLLPVNRGIFTTIYLGFELKDNTNGGIEEIGKSIEHSFNKYYRDELFVKFIGKKIPHIKDVVGSNKALISYLIDERTSTVKLFCVIDNILKGASGQAIQNMNIMFKFKEDEGLNLNGIFN
jgi:N-acetyl-gamma-glutamyl-phosphate reductase